MEKQIPRKDELLTIIFKEKIAAFFKERKTTIGFDFFGMAERTPYGSMFASSDPGIAQLLYEKKWYGHDPAINRDVLKVHELALNSSTFALYQQILHAKRQQCYHLGYFTIPLYIGETELYFCIATTTSLEKLKFLKRNCWHQLIKIGLEFRKYMHALSDTRFTYPRHIREMYTYFIVGNFAFEGKETLQLSNLEKRNVEIARFCHRVKELYRIVSKNFIGFTYDIYQAMEEKLSGGNVNKLIIIENPLFETVKNSPFSNSLSRTIYTPPEDIKYNLLNRTYSKNFFNTYFI